MTKQFTHNCFICKYSNWEFYEEVPIIHYLHCKLGHEKTSYNTPFDEDFICNDYNHSYFVKSYVGIWIWSIYISFFLIMIVICYLQGNF